MNVIAGVDTHAGTHHVAIITEYGKHVADKEFVAVGSGYRKIIAFITQFGTVIGIGVEGTGSYGAELARVRTNEGLKGAGGEPAQPAGPPAAAPAARPC